MFIIDHFWHSVVKPTLSTAVDPLSKERARRGQSASAAISGSGRDDESRETTIPMDVFQERMFEFFNRREIPLLQIIDIELIITECFKYLISKNKRKDQISKRTLKKVITRHCHGTMVRSLNNFVSKGSALKTVEERHSSLTPISVPQSEGTDNNTSRNHSNLGSRRDQPSNRVATLQTLAS